MIDATYDPVARAYYGLTRCPSCGGAFAIYLESDELFWTGSTRCVTCGDITTETVTMPLDPMYRNR